MDVLALLATEKNGQDPVIHLYANTCVRAIIGQEEMADMRKKYTTSLDEKLIEWIKIQAIKENTKPNHIIERLITEYKEQKEREENRK